MTGMLHWDWLSEEIGSAFLIPGDDPSGDGKGTNNNIANVKTGFGIIHQNAKKDRG
jgi:hypothetical protein